MDTAPLGADAVDQHEYQQFVQQCVARLRARMAAANAQFGLDSFERYDYDLAQRRFWWSHGGIPRVEASVLAIGSTSKRTGTWLWAWANPHVADVVSPELKRVRAFGVEHGIQPIETAKWDGDEVDGWEMTAIAASLLDADAAYRSPHDHGALFLLLSGLRRAGD